MFPYKFVNNEKVKLDYKGKVPRLKFFDLNKFKGKEYADFVLEFKNYMKDFINKPWDLREETIKYSELDTVILYNVLITFSHIIYERFRVDAFKYPTISSLAFAIYRTNNLKENTIPIINGSLYKDLKEGFTGGSCDVYKCIGRKINVYDINSLYPSVMANSVMPVGEPVYFEGDISKYEKDSFGFFEVEVTAPLDLEIPILQVRIKTNEGIRTIAPVGNWIGTFFSEEIKEAITLGYKIKNLRGYLFKKENIFKEFILDLYKYKENSDPGSADYTIFKLLMNSLYGRFGMAPEI